MLAKLGLLALQHKQLRGDLIEVFKIINRFDNVNFQNWFQYNPMQCVLLGACILHSSVFFVEKFLLTKMN